MDSLKESIQQSVNKIRYTYYLLFCPEKIEIPKDISESDYREYSKQVYQQALKIHEKLGAKRFLKFVRKLDKAKYRFIKDVITEERFLSWCDKLNDYSQAQRLKKAKTEEEKQKIITDKKRSKLLVRIQLREEKSANYFQGIDPELGVFATYLEQNKNIHEQALKINGILLLGSIGLGIAGVPLLPILLGGYQILAGFKNFECINAQLYNLKRIAIRGKSLGKRTAKEAKKWVGVDNDLTGEKVSELQGESRRQILEPTAMTENEAQVVTQLPFAKISQESPRPLIEGIPGFEAMIESATTIEQLDILRQLLGIEMEQTIKPQETEVKMAIKRDRRNG